MLLLQRIYSWHLSGLGGCDRWSLLGLLTLLLVSIQWLLKLLGAQLLGLPARIDGTDVQWVYNCHWGIDTILDLKEQAENYYCSSVWWQLVCLHCAQIDKTCQGSNCCWMILHEYTNTTTCRWVCCLNELHTASQLFITVLYNQGQVNLIPKEAAYFKLPLEQMHKKGIESMMLWIKTVEAIFCQRGQARQEHIDTWLTVSLPQKLERWI